MRKNGFVLLLLAGCGEVVPPGGVNGADAGPAPTLESVSPDHGPIVGGIEVSISGAGFQLGDATDAQVVVGDVQATDVAVAGDGTITFTLPPGLVEGEVVDVTVFNQNGFSRLEDAFRYNERPVVLSISPETGRGAGGANVTITGRGFEELEAGTNVVTIAGVEATNVVVVDDTTLTATTAATTAEGFTPQDVVVENANGTVTMEGAFRVTQPGLIAVDRHDNARLYYVNPTTGDAIQIGRAERRVHNCATAPNGTMYAVVRRPTDSVFELVTFNPLTGSVTTIGETQDGVGHRGVTGLTFVGNTLYGFTSRINNSTISRTLASINTSTGAVTNIGAAIAQSGSRCAGFTARDADTVYFLENMSSTLDTLTVAGAARTAGVQVTGATDEIHGMTTIDGVTYVSGRNGGTIFRLDTSTGVLSDFTRISGVSLGGLCATPPTF